MKMLGRKNCGHHLPNHVHHQKYPPQISSSNDIYGNYLPKMYLFKTKKYLDNLDFRGLELSNKSLLGQFTRSSIEAPLQLQLIQLDFKT